MTQMDATPTTTAAADAVTAGSERGRLGLAALTAVVIGSMIGSGVFNLPQNMAAGAGPLAIIIGWVISGIGILALAMVYQGLSTRKPELNSGPYAYAKAGFGPFIGFNSAWGYWISAWIGNVSYAVVMFSALSYFFPVFGEGNTWQAILGASAVLWLIHALVLSGVRQAAFVNTITTVAKIAPILLFIAVVIVAFRLDVFTMDFSGLATPSLGSVLDQVRSTMLVTLWVFIGIEGASIVGPTRVTIQSGDVLALPIALQVPRESLQGNSNAEVRFTVKAVGQGGIQDTAESRFLGPGPAR